jgi:translation initiation factor 1A
MGKKKQVLAAQQKREQEIQRIKLPRPPESLGIVEQRLGGSRMSVRCLDGVTRICRIPGRLKRRLWVREGDVVIVEPWEYSNDKGDILFKYRPSQTEYLRRTGRLAGLEDLDEF